MNKGVVAAIVVASILLVTAIVIASVALSRTYSNTPPPPSDEIGSANATGTFKTITVNKITHAGGTRARQKDNGSTSATAETTGLIIDADIVATGRLDVAGQVAANGVNAGTGEVIAVGGVVAGTAAITAGTVTLTGAVTCDGIDAGAGAMTGASLTTTGQVMCEGLDAGLSDIITTGSVIATNVTGTVTAVIDAQPAATLIAPTPYTYTSAFSAPPTEIELGTNDTGNIVYDMNVELQTQGSRSQAPPGTRRR